MKERPKRKQLRLKGYDYASDGAYFVTICAKSRTYVFWEDVGANIVRPQNTLPFSAIGKIVDNKIQQIETIYRGVSVDKYCIMPDHIHILIVLTNHELELVTESGEQCSPLHSAEIKMTETHNPTISRIVKQLKGAVTKEIDHSIWQKSFVDRIIRSQNGYDAVWEYIHYNPVQLDFAYDNIDFDLF
jgi:REP element-mobilizing transposase RayT